MPSPTLLYYNFRSHFLLSSSMAGLHKRETHLRVFVWALASRQTWQALAVSSEINR